MDDNRKLYENEKHWGKLKCDDKFLSKARMIKALIPSDVKSILDVGCGDGALTNLLDSNRYRIVGYDRSLEALSHVQTEKQQGSTDNICFDDKSFDLVLCSQVLEHLSGKIYLKSIDELKRVAAKYLIIGVPFRDILSEYKTKCPKCGHIYHLWGHVRSYRNIKQLEKLFSGFKIQAHFFNNTMEHPNAILLKLKQCFGNEWRSDEAAVCPKCGCRERMQDERINKLVKYVTDRISWRLGEKTETWSMVGLFKRIGSK